MSLGAAVVAAVLLAVFGDEIAHAFDLSPAQPSTNGFQGFRPGGGFGGTPTFFAARLAGRAQASPPRR